MVETYQGGRHSGRVRFRVRADLSGVSKCNCSICTKKVGGLTPYALPSGCVTSPSQRAVSRSTRGVRVSRTFV